MIEILQKYHPPENFKFPVTKMGKDKNEAKRSCHYEWFKKWEWLHYSLENDSLFCFPCNQAYVKKKLLNTKVEKSFIFGDGFSM